MLICCQKSSLEDLDKKTLSHFGLLSNTSSKNNYKSGFTLIEVLIVILVIGILSATGVSSYSGVIQDTRIKSVSDRIETYLSANIKKAKLRKVEIKLLYDDKANSFQDPTSTTNFLKVPELYPPSVPKQIEITKSGKIRFNGLEQDNIKLSILLPGNRLATISIKL